MGAVGLFVHTQVIIPDFIRQNCTDLHVSRLKVAPASSRIQKKTKNRIEDNFLAFDPNNRHTHHITQSCML